MTIVERDTPWQHLVGTIRAVEDLQRIETNIRDVDTRLGGVNAGPDLATQLRDWTNGGAFRLNTVTRDVTTGAITTATVTWPDGVAGTLTADTASTTFPGAVDAYHVTYEPSGGPVRTITQPAVTRDARAEVTAQPALTIVSA